MASAVTHAAISICAHARTRTFERVGTAARACARHADTCGARIDTARGSTQQHEAYRGKNEAIEAHLGGNACAATSAKLGTRCPLSAARRTEAMLLNEASAALLAKFSSGNRRMTRIACHNTGGCRLRVRHLRRLRRLHHAALSECVRHAHPNTKACTCEHRPTFAAAL